MTKQTTKTKQTEDIVTPVGTIVFASVDRPRNSAMAGQEENLKYSLTLMLDPSAKETTEFLAKLRDDNKGVKKIFEQVDATTNKLVGIQVKASTKHKPKLFDEQGAEVENLNIEGKDYKKYLGSTANMVVTQAVFEQFGTSSLYLKMVSLKNKVVDENYVSESLTSDIQARLLAAK